MMEQAAGTSRDLALVERLRAGDERAFEELVDRETPTMLRVARMYCTNAVAEEVVQETWIGVLQGVDRFEGRASLRTWIFRILANIARSRGEREHRQLPFSAFADPTAEAEAAVDADRFRPAGDPWAGHWVSYPERWEERPEERFLSLETRDAVLAAISQLPPAQREVVTLRDIDGWTSEEVCEALSISQGNQRVLLHRGRSRVRGALERLELAGRMVGAAADVGAAAEGMA